MIIKIFTGPLNYNVETLYQKDEFEYIIGVDQGCELLLKNNIDIDLALGDFDSIDVTLLDDIKANAKEVKEYKIKKNYTDTYLAISEALQLEHDEIIVYGGIGKRFDHGFANMNLLKLGNIVMKNDDTLMYMLDPGTYEIDNQFKYISLFAMEDVKELSLQGFLYELNNIELVVDDPLCISNEGSGKISFNEGMLLVVQQDE